MEPQPAEDTNQGVKTVFIVKSHPALKELFKEIIHIEKYSQYWDKMIDYVRKAKLIGLKELSKEKELKTYLYSLDDLEKRFGTRELYETFRNEIDKKIDKQEKIPEIKLDYIYSKIKLNEEDIKEAIWIILRSIMVTFGVDRVVIIPI